MHSTQYLSCWLFWLLFLDFTFSLFSWCKRNKQNCRQRLFLCICSYITNNRITTIGNGTFVGVTCSGSCSETTRNNYVWYVQAMNRAIIKVRAGCGIVRVFLLVWQCRFMILPLRWWQTCVHKCTGFYFKKAYFIWKIKNFVTTFKISNIVIKSNILSVLHLALSWKACWSCNRAGVDVSAES